ncbi:MAG: ATP-dependent Clp protease adaptor ClpS [Nonlabens sp.]|jgi:ATP-dependent Clp protease adaptor protein ClpS|uniref:ATP-dependent Clp protease adaptor ClpS n=1 Tax=Nonlabens sp. TaxID=1888209 RepID=UPI0035A648A6
MNTQEQVLPELELEVLEQKENKIVLFNDEVNTFDHVIDMLVAACDHTPIQAEQCSLIVHYKGKCNVKTGDYDDLKPRCTALLEAGLTAEIQ